MTLPVTISSAVGAGPVVERECGRRVWWLPGEIVPLTDHSPLVEDEAVGELVFGRGKKIAIKTMSAPAIARNHGQRGPRLESSGGAEGFGFWLLIRAAAYS